MQVVHPSFLIHSFNTEMWLLRFMLRRYAALLFPPVLAHRMLGFWRHFVACKLVERFWPVLLWASPLCLSVFHSSRTMRIPTSFLLLFKFPSMCSTVHPSSARSRSIYLPHSYPQFKANAVSTFKAWCQAHVQACKAALPGRIQQLAPPVAAQALSLLGSGGLH